MYDHAIYSFEITVVNTKKIRKGLRVNSTTNKSSIERMNIAFLKKTTCLWYGLLLSEEMKAENVLLNDENHHPAQSQLFGTQRS